MVPASAASSALSALVEDLASLGSIAVAYTGGVDSAVVAALAHRALGDRAQAVTAVAETLAARELDHARRLAGEIGIRHVVLTHSELSNPEFVANPSYRCYVCQGMRMDLVLDYASARGIAAVCDGTNASDPGPDRPGLAAIVERGVRSPLLEHGIDKERTRLLANTLGLSVWDRPANACLSSRIPHGQVVTLGKLRRVETAEGLLLDLGFRVVRVRHDGDRARVEVGAEELARLRSIWPRVEAEIRDLGFATVELDAAGYRPGGADRAMAGPSASA
jgi:uncharacterized protein (TIGR00268 family)